MMIASAIFAIAAAVAFILYTAAQKSYKAGQNFTDQQQNTRAAFDRVLSDIRNAGYNYNPDGSKARTDEQIEAAYDTAIVLRADLDFEDSTLSAAPESSIKGVFNTVSTGNDEIVAYVLAKPNWTGGSTLTFNADVDNATRAAIVYLGNNINVGPRDTTVDPVRLANVALVQDNPPYTLYRVSLNNDVSSYSSGANPTADAFFVKQPVADNIKSMTFRYYNDQGTLISPNTPASVADDIGGVESNSGTRAGIRRIVVDMVGMTPDPDLRYSDPADASALTVHYRKFDLTSDVTPENLGRSGIQDSDTTPPGQVSPAPTVCIGHCQGVLVSWTGRPASELVTSYNIGYGSTGAATPYVVNAPYPHYDNGVANFTTHGFIRDAAHFTNGSTWYFKVQAKDSSSNVGTFSTSTATAALADTTTPAAPASGWATQKGSSIHPPHDGDVEVHWNAVTTNASGPTGCTDSDAPMIRDLKGYRVWRGTTSGFAPSGLPLADETALAAGTIQLTDANIAQCQPYYYKVAAADLCGNIGAYSPAIAGSSDTIIVPQSPTNVLASRTSQNAITISWNPVVQDVSSRTIQVASYEVLYAAGTVGFPPSSGLFSPVPGSPVMYPTVTLMHSLSSTDKDYLRVQNNTYYYLVRAVDACPNFSLYSNAAATSCTFNGNVAMTPSNNTHVAGSVPISLTVSGGGDTYVRARIRINNSSTGVNAYDSGDVTAYPFTFQAWNAAALNPGNYTAYIEVENSLGCINFKQQTLIVDSVLACQISPANPNLSPTTGKAGGTNRSQLTFDIINNAQKDLFITGVDVTWTNVLGYNPLLTSFSYPTGITPPNKTWSPAAISPATASFCSTCILLDRTNDNTNPVNLQLDFTNSLAVKGGSGEEITITFHFHDISNTTGTCTFQVIAKDLTII